MQGHLQPLYSAIRNKALIQYVTPFTSVNLALMATAFATSIGCATVCVHFAFVWPVAGGGYT